ncbi:adaptin ear-binding coat-associated protein 1 [Limosa lapponica baueri]|uniref:Adaptin ear-binding coat-associated protein 1 n=1 Tax=Limosa lapponica baueri TaxID=1758121 RepID=A0A2I0U9Y1_LIMLA|nr:adaptin ear-binding coat-associated protein 1 [Limosa lapponica baueri]
MRGEEEITGPVRTKLKGNTPGLEGWQTSKDSYSTNSFQRSDRHLEITETPERGLVRNGAHTHKKMLKPLARLKCIYTNARSMNNKQGDLEAMMHQENYDIVAIAETWWDASHDWSATIKGYKLFRRDRQERRGGGVAVCVSGCYESSEIKYSDNRVESVWIRIRANKGDIAVGVCYRPPNQSSEVDEAFYKQLGEISQSFATVLVGDFNLPDICWEYNMADREQSRRFLECVEDNFLMQLVSEPTRESALLGLILVNRKELVGEVKVGGHLGHSDHEMIEFSILGETRRRVTKTATLDFWRPNFNLFRRLLDKIPWEDTLKDTGVQEGWTYFRKEVLKAQEQAVPMCRKTSRRGRRPAWLNRDLLLDLKNKRRVYNLWNRGQASHEDYRGSEAMQGENKESQSTAGAQPSCSC